MRNGVVGGEGSYVDVLRNAKIDQVLAHCEDSPEYVRVLDRSGHSPLMGASRLGRVDLVTLLLEHGADPPFQGSRWCLGLELRSPARDRGGHGQQ